MTDEPDLRHPGVAVALLGWLFLLAAVPMGVGAQVAIDTVLVLGEREGPGYVGTVQSVARGPGGRWLFVFTEEPSRIAVFDSTGQFQRRYGRPGRGPREFSLILDVWADADSIYVNDPGNRKIVVLDDDLQFIRSVPIDAVSARVVRSGGRFYMFRERPDPRSPLYSISVDGGPAESIPEEGSPGPTPRRALAVDRFRSVWVAEFERYVVRRVDDDGVARRVLAPDGRGFVEGRPYGWDREEPDREPGRALQDMAFLDSDLLATLVLAPADGWEDGIGMRDGLRGRRTLGIVDSHGVWDSIVDVWHPNTAELIGSVRLDSRILHLLDGGWLVESTEDEMGFPSVRIFRIRADR